MNDTGPKTPRHDRPAPALPDPPPDPGHHPPAPALPDPPPDPGKTVRIFHGDELAASFPDGVTRLVTLTIADGALRITSIP